MRHSGPRLRPKASHDRRLNWMAGLAKSPSAISTWQRPPNASPAAAESRSTPSARGSANSRRRQTLPVCRKVKPTRSVKRSTGRSGIWMSAKAASRKSRPVPRNLRGAFDPARSSRGGETWPAGAQLTHYAGVSRPSCSARIASQCVSYSALAEAAQRKRQPPLPDRRRKAPPGLATRREIERCRTLSAPACIAAASIARINRSTIGVWPPHVRLSR